MNRNKIMKRTTLLAMGLCAAIGLTGVGPTAVSAAEGHEHHETEEGGKVTIPETVEGIFKEIHEHHAELAEVVKNKKLDEVHHLAFAIRDLTKALPAKASAQQKKRVEAAVRNIAVLAEALDKSGDAGDQARTEASLKKLDAELKTLQTEFGIKTQNGDQAVQYTCPMHPEVVQDKPGKCPKCGMDLVEKHWPTNAPSNLLAARAWRGDKMCGNRVCCVWLRAPIHCTRTRGIARTFVNGKMTIHGHTQT
jgi:rubrerythrin